ncbi:MAG: amidohydrolase [Actinomycetota bacterium]|nr:amidohydrolase [Actinomycetota bacterium]
MRTVYRNGRIVSPAAAPATGLAVEDGLITWVGAGEPPVELASADVVDLSGALVTPAFVDAHLHATATGLALDTLDLSAARSGAEVLQAVERAARSGRGRPVIGSGWDESSWPEDQPPTSTELDRAAYGGLVYLARVDVHSAIVSTVLSRAVEGITAMSGYRTDGWLSRDAHDAARAAALSRLSAPQIAHAQHTALTRAASAGIACVHEMAGPSISSPDDLTSLLRLAAEDPLPEVIGYWGELFGTEAARDLGAVGAGGDLFCDGSLGSHTAALNRPYSDQPLTSGDLRFDTADLAEHILSCVRVGLQAGFHAIGDRAVDQVLDAFELAATRLPGCAAPGVGHRIEHAEMVADIPRLARLGLCASMQPVFDATWGGRHGMYVARLGEDRGQTLNAFADLFDAGVPLAFGSDSPVTSLGPWEAVRAAAYPITGRAGMSVADAFTAHTRAGWRAARRSDSGELSTGQAATFAVWDAPGTAARLPDLTPGAPPPRCLRTVSRGTVIFS